MNRYADNEYLPYADCLASTFNDAAGNFFISWDYPQADDYMVTDGYQTGSASDPTQAAALQDLAAAGPEAWNHDLEWQVEQSASVTVTDSEAMTNLVPITNAAPEPSPLPGPQVLVVVLPQVVPDSQAEHHSFKLCQQHPGHCYPHHIISVCRVSVTVSI